MLRWSGVGVGRTADIFINALYSPSFRAVNVELLEREAGAVDCGFENLLVCLFLGMTTRGQASVLSVAAKQ